MKKKSILLITSLLISVFSFSQINFGIKAGLNNVKNTTVTDFSDYETEFNEYRLSYHIGINSKIHLTDKFFIAPELLYSNKGYKSETGDFNVYFNYFNLPVLIGFKPFEKFSLLLGPELGYMISANAKSDSQTIDASDFWDNNFDYGLSVGIQYDVFDRISLGLRYTHGFASVTKITKFYNLDPLNPTLYDVKFQNRTFQFSIAFRIK